jgi:glycosyltransferase involved in cell wall biosynthesis
MRAVIFSWEYPPRIVGKLAEYVSTLATDLVKNKVETYVVTYHDSVTGAVEEPNGAKVTRVTNPVHSHVSLLTWDLTLNQEVERAAANIYYKAQRQIDVIDVYDWHFIPAAVTIKNALGIPFVYSVDSLEDHRSPANAPFNMAIRGIEWLGLFEAAAVTAKTDWMKNEIIRIYKVPKEKITVIPPSADSWVKDIISVYSSVKGGSEKP